MMGDYQSPMDNFGGGFGPENFANGGNFNANPPPQIPAGNPLQQQMPGMFQRTVIFLHFEKKAGRMVGISYL